MIMAAQHTETDVLKTEWNVSILSDANFRALGHVQQQAALRCKRYMLLGWLMAKGLPESAARNIANRAPANGWRI